jgi:ribosomal protein L14
MPSYTTYTRGGTPLVRFDAPADEHSVPTSITSLDGDDRLVGYLTDLQKSFPDASVLFLSSRLGSYNYTTLDGADNEGAADDAAPVEKKRAPLGDMIVAAIEKRNLRRQQAAQDVGDAVEITATGTITKSDDEQQIVYGWAYVTHDREGNVSVDKSGDFVDEIEQIEKSAINFMSTPAQAT